MNTLTKHSFATSTTIAVLLIWGQNHALRNLDSLIGFAGDKSIALLLSAGAVALLYRAIVAVYQKWAWRLIHRDACLAGRWHHRLTRKDTPNDSRHGEFEIVQTIFETRMRGVNRGGIDGKESHWRSVGVICDTANDEIWVVYQIRRQRERLAHGEAEIDNGLLRLDLIRDQNSGKVVRMEGQHMDAGRSQRRGTFTAARA